MKKALYWFTNDLRLQDNMSLSSLLMQSDSIAFVYVLDPRWFKQNNYQHKHLGEHRFRFIVESLRDLDAQLRSFGHHLTVLHGEPVPQLLHFVSHHRINLLGCASQVGWNERRVWQYLVQQLPQVNGIACWNSTLFEPEQLERGEDALASFSRFRKQVEQQPIAPVSPCKIWLDTLPPPLAAEETSQQLDTVLHEYRVSMAASCQRYADTRLTHEDEHFIGGERAALLHLERYFTSQAPGSYKQTRNDLDGWSTSTKFSPYLAVGNVSPRQIWQRLGRYQEECLKNESTYWIGFELLWREYFQWWALAQKSRLFALQGSAATRPLTSYYGERFIKWCQGCTPYPLVNACMHQLNATGFMSNRGRQIVASCLVNELSIDWRYGAAYFQQQLIDYDVASNWGNWQYIAGVGADPRGGRHFNLAKQTQLYDANEVFINKWHGKQQADPLDSVDAADWPIPANGSYRD